MSRYTEGTIPDGVPVADVVVIGAGVIGAAVAIRAIAAGKSVLMLEAGIGDALLWDQYSSYTDTFRTSAAKATSTGYPANTSARWPDVLQIGNAPAVSGSTNDPTDPPGYAIPPGQPMTSSYYVEAGPQPFRSDFLKMAGGTTLHWQGSSFRMLPADFELQKRYGKAIDWPLGYDELEPYYEDAEHQIGVAADVDDQTYLEIWFRDKYVYPMQRMPQSYVDQFLTSRIGDLPVKVSGFDAIARGIPLPSGRNTEPNPHYHYRRDPDGVVGYSPVSAVGDRNAGLRCQGNSSCMPVCPVQAKYSALKSIDQLMRSPNFQLQTRSVATSFMVDPATNKVTGVTVKRYTGAPSDPNPSYRLDTVYGRTVVLAGNAIENAKLLLNAGIAADNPHLGKNLMDHPYLYITGTTPTPVHPFRGPDTTTGIDSLRDGKYRAIHAAFRASISNWGWSGSPGKDVTTMLLAGTYGSALREQLADRLTRQFKFGFMLEQLPSASNSVTTDPAYLDAFGDPRPVLHYDYDEYVMRGAEAAHDVAMQIFDKAGITDTTDWDTPAKNNVPGNNYRWYNGRWYAIMGAGHIVGTHRMGRTADDGVTDVNGVVFGHPNLYAVGCGSMVTIGTSNPTLTAVALAHKAGDAIVEALR
jgi:choline dehydrogenase-like flavoprotein